MHKTINDKDNPIILDLKSKKILYELHDDCRQTNVKIGKKIGLSKQAVAKRIDFLEKTGIIKGYNTFFKVTFDSTDHLLYIKLIDNSNINDLILSLSKLEGVVSVVRCMPYYDIGIYIVGNSNTKVQYIVASINKEIGNLIMKKMLLQFSCPMFAFKPDFLIGNNSREYFIIKNRKEAIPNTYKQIIGELANNSRERIIELSKKSSISEDTIRKNIKLALKDNLIYFRISMNTKIFGYYLVLFCMQIDGNPDSIDKMLLKFCLSDNRIIDFLRINGHYNYILSIFIKDISELIKIQKMLKEVIFTGIIRDCIFNIHFEETIYNENRKNAIDTFY